MKRLLLCSFLLVNGWTKACRPIAPNESHLRASKAFLEARAKNQTACRGISQVNCTVYNAPPYQVVQWHRMIGETWEKTGTSWTNSEDRYGLVSTLKPIGGGTIVTTIDRLTAWEKLEKRLSGMRTTHLPFQTCNSLGLSDSAYSISDCQWRSRDMTFKITAATDKSLPAGLYEWLELGTCGYSLQGPKK